ERARHGSLEIADADAGDVGARRHEVPNRRLRPTQYDLVVSDTDAELEIRRRRRCEDEYEQYDRYPSGDLHRPPPASVRTRDSKSASARGCREMSPAAMRGPTADGRMPGGVTTQPDSSADRVIRYTP